MAATRILACVVWLLCVGCGGSIQLPMERASTLDEQLRDEHFHIREAFKLTEETLNAFGYPPDEIDRSTLDLAQIQHLVTQCFHASLRNVEGQESRDDAPLPDTGQAILDEGFARIQSCPGNASEALESYPEAFGEINAAWLMRQLWHADVLRMSIRSVLPALLSVLMDRASYARSEVEDMRALARVELRKLEDAGISKKEAYRQTKDDYLALETLLRSIETRAEEMTLDAELMPSRLEELMGLVSRELAQMGQ